MDVTQTVEYKLIKAELARYVAAYDALQQTFCLELSNMRNHDCEHAKPYTDAQNEEYERTKIRPWIKCNCVFCQTRKLLPLPLTKAKAAWSNLARLYKEVHGYDIA